LSSACIARYANGGLHAPRILYFLKSTFNFSQYLLHVNFCQDTEPLFFQLLGRTGNGFFERQLGAFTKMAAHLTCSCCLVGREVSGDRPFSRDICDPLPFLQFVSLRPFSRRVVA
jgi:hypothetical protein